jgi:hypothetical protein
MNHSSVQDSLRKSSPHRLTVSYGEFANGDGLEIGILRSSTHTWYPDKSGDGVDGPGDLSYTNFGQSTDKQVTGIWS